MTPLPDHLACLPHLPPCCDWSDTVVVVAANVLEEREALRIQKRALGALQTADFDEDLETVVKTQAQAKQAAKVTSTNRMTGCLAVWLAG